MNKPQKPYSEIFANKDLQEEQKKLEEQEKTEEVLNCPPFVRPDNTNSN